MLFRSPKFDQQSLRENYIEENIFKVGQFVENLNTGMVGRIIRRGTNYLICVTENGMMFKSWIKDIQESYSEKQMSRMMRLPIKTYSVNLINKNRKKVKH